MSNAKLVSPNYTQIPNVLLDDLMAEMSSSELRVVLGICRKTFGWHKEADQISLTQLEVLTGLSRQGVINGINAALDRGIVERENLGDGRGFAYQLVVNSVDQGSQLSRPGVVNSVDTQKKVKETNKRNGGPPSAGANAPKSSHQEWFDWLLVLCYNGDCGRGARQAIGKLAKSLSSRHDLRTAKVFEKWWSDIDWRGKRGQTPRPSDVENLLATAIKWDREGRPYQDDDQPARLPRYDEQVESAKRVLAEKLQGVQG